MRPTSPSPVPARVPPCAPGLPRRTVLRGTGAAALVLALGGCRIRLGSGVAESLPVPPDSEATRDALARRASLIASTADVVAAGSTDSTAARLAASARTQLDALGGVWAPWAGEAPSGFPTVEPVPTAAPDASAADLVTALTEGSDEAGQAAAESEDATTAHLYASLALAWLLGAVDLDSSAETITARSRGTVTVPLPDAVVTAYDEVRYACEQIAARTTGSDSSRASADAAQARGVVSASLALGGQDTRLAAYSPPAQADDGTSLETTWARRVWEAVMTAELAGIGAAEGSTTLDAIGAAAGAAAAARTWGAAVDEALPGT